MSSIYGVSVGGNTYDITDSSNVAPKEPTSYASREYNVGRCFIMSDGKLYKATEHIAAGDAIVVNVNVIQTNIDELFESITPEQITSIEPMLNILGAKNLLPNNATTQTVNGITFTVNADGSVTVSTDSSGATVNTGFDLSSSTLEDMGLKVGERYTLSGCPSGGSNSTFMLNIPNFGTDIGSGVTSSVNSSNINQKCRIVITQGTIITTPISFKPMIRPASVADDTYVPYAMTNRALTDFASNINSMSRVDKTTSSALGNNSWGNVCSKTLTAGTYLVIAQNEFGGNSSGRRGTGIGTSSVTVKYGRVFAAAPDNNTFSMQYVTVITLTETTVITNQAIQSSGTTIDHLNGSLITIKLS